MVAARHQVDTTQVTSEVDEDAQARYVTAEEARAMFDYQARKSLGISGDEFLRRWDRGEYQPVPDTREGWKIGHLVMLIPFGRATDAEDRG